MLRALTRFLDTGVPVIGVELRPRRLPDGDPGRRARDRAGAGVRGRVRGRVELPTLEVEVGGDRGVAVNDAVVVERHARPDGRARVLDRRRGARHAAVRRPDLRDAAGLDGLQPLERRPGARLGPRRDGADVRRAAHPARAPARRRAADSSSRSSTGPSTARRVVLVDGHQVGSLAPGEAVDGALRRQPDACSRRCPSRRSSAATPRSSASTAAPPARRLREPVVVHRPAPNQYAPGLGLWTKFPEVDTPLSQVLTGISAVEGGGKRHPTHGWGCAGQGRSGRAEPPCPARRPRDANPGGAG